MDPDAALAELRGKIAGCEADMRTALCQYSACTKY